MRSVQILGVVGNTKESSRTLALTDRLGSFLTRRLRERGAEVAYERVDLAGLAGEMFAWPSDRLDELVKTAGEADVLLAGSPTFKATYTGLLKSFFDRFPSQGLRGTVGVPVMTGAASIHALAAEVHLRPVLVEMGATCPTRGLFVTEMHLDDPDDVIAAWWEEAGDLVATALRLAPG